MRVCDMPVSPVAAEALSRERSARHSTCVCPRSAARGMLRAPNVSERRSEHGDSC